MLTYATIAAGSGAGGRALAEYLLQTVSSERADLASYYQRGMRPDLAGALGDDTFAAEATALVRGRTTLGELPTALDAAVQTRHTGFVEHMMAGEEHAPDIVAIARLAEHVVTSADPAAEGERIIERLRATAQDAAGRGRMARD